jgi:hypothetical protein
MDTKYGDKNCLNELNELKFCEFCEKKFLTEAESFSFLSWKQKCFIPKKEYNLGLSLYISQESSNRWRSAVPIFREGFALYRYEKALLMHNMQIVYEMN